MPPLGVLLSQRIILSGLKLKHHFGAIIKRSLDNVHTADRQIYTAWSADAAFANRQNLRHRHAARRVRRRVARGER